MKNELRKMEVDELKLKNSYSWIREFISLSQENRAVFMEWVNSGPHSNTVGGDNAP